MPARNTPHPHVLVIGAGIIGCLVAREILAGDPNSRVTLLDRQAPGSGASRYSAGVHIPRGHTDLTRALSTHSHAYYAELRRRGEGARPPSTPLPAVLVGSAADAAPWLADYLPLARLQRTACPPLGSLADTVRVPDDLASWELAGCHHADVGALCRDLSAALGPRGILRPHATVRTVSADSTGVLIRLADGEVHRGDAAVLAPGPWVAHDPWRDLLAPFGLRVKRVAALHLSPAPAPRDPLVIFTEEDAFLLPLPAAGHWLFSFTSEQWDVDPDAAHRELSASDRATAGKVLSRYAPTLSDLTSGARVFCDAYSPTREPIIRPIPGAERIVFAGGANGSGYRLAPGIARQALRLLPPELRLAAREQDTEETP